MSGEIFMKKCVVLFCPGLFEWIQLFGAVWALWENKNHDPRVEDWDLPDCVKMPHKYD